MKKLFAMLGASLVQSLYKKLGPSRSAAAPKPSLKERLARRLRNMPKPPRSMFYILLGVGTALATVAWLRTFGFPQVPTIVSPSWQLPRLQFGWSATSAAAVTLGLGFVVALLWLAIKVREEKARSARSAAPAGHSSAASVLPPLPPVTFTPPAAAPAAPFVATNVPTAAAPAPTVPAVTPVPGTIATTTPPRPRRAQRPTATPTPPPVPPPATAGAQQAGAPAGSRSYLGHVGLAFGIAATLVLLFSGKGGNGGQPEEPRAQAEQSERPLQPNQSVPAESNSVVITAADPEVVITVGKEWSKQYIFLGKMAHIRSLDDGVTYEVKVPTHAEPFRYGPGMNPPIPYYDAAQVRAVGDKPIRIWLKAS